MNVWPVAISLHAAEFTSTKRSSGGGRRHEARQSSQNNQEKKSLRAPRKITVIDGVIGYTGGMKLGQEHLDGGEDFDAWRDTQVRIEGEGATVLQAVFLVDWYNAVRENLFSPAYFPAAAGQAARVDPERGGCPNVPVQIITSGPDSQWRASRSSTPS